MRNRLKLPMALAVTAILLTSLASGAPKPGDKPLRLDDFSVSDHVVGPKAKLGKSGSKLTVLYLWGWRCAPCMQTLPKLVTLDKVYRDKGLEIIGIHAASGKMEDVRATCRKRKVKFAVYRAYKAPSQASAGILPKVFIFNEKGELIFDGHHSQITKEIEKYFK